MRACQRFRTHARARGPARAVACVVLSTRPFGGPPRRGGTNMHALPYETKRAHWKATWMMIHEFRAKSETLKFPDLKAMTPARFDILHTLYYRPAWFERKPDTEYLMNFGDIVIQLGLHPSTISKTVKRLVELELVTKHELPHDRRQIYVTLTKRGEAAMHAAWAALFGQDEFFFRETINLSLIYEYDESLLDEDWSLDHRDEMLLAFANRIRKYAWCVGSNATPMYDPYFVDAGIRFRPKTHVCTSASKRLAWT